MSHNEHLLFPKLSEPQVSLEVKSLIEQHKTGGILRVQISENTGLQGLESKPNEVKPIDITLSQTQFEGLAKLSRRRLMRIEDVVKELILRELHHF